MKSSMEDALVKSKNEFVRPKPAKLSKIDSIEDRKETETSAIQCNFCHDSFENQENLTDHVISIHCMITCKVCDKVFPNSPALKEHFSNVHVAKNVKCEKCEMEFSTKNFLSKHYENVHFDTKTLETSSVNHDKKRSIEVNCLCDFCFKMFNSWVDFSTHTCINKDFNEKRPILQCDLCEEKFQVISNFKRHYHGKHSMLGQSNCDICGVMFRGTDRLQFHLLNGLNSMPQQCNFCKKLCYPTCSKEVHMEKCKKRKNIECSFCDKKFASYFSRNKHVKRRHDTQCTVA